MKTYSLIAAALAAVGLVSSANGQAVVRITGSTAFRAQVNRVLHAGTGIFDNTPTVIGTPYSDGASQLVFSNTIASSPTVIKVSWTGSEAGIAALANVSIINPSASNNAAILPGTPEPTWLDTATGLTLNDVNHPDIAMADTSQAVSLTQGGGVVDKGTVGVVQFCWMKGKSNGQPGWTNLSNITLPQVNILLSQGIQALTFFDGNINDANTSVVAVGRNKGSGTRVNELISATYGVTKNVIQYAVSPTYAQNGTLNTASSSTPINDAAIVNIGNDGFDSGKGVAQTLLMTAGGGTLTTIPVGFLGLNDCASVQPLNSDGVSAPSGGSQQYLTVNGVPYSDANISVGTYDAWGHEHLLTGSFTSTIGATVAGKLVTQIPAQATGGIFGIQYNIGVTMFADRPGGGDTGFVSIQ